MAMDARKYRILQAIIDDYILTAIPVGSRTISKKYDMGLSSATIRNEMSDLEELGYLDQPHISAGRIPSVKAYRLYVDHLLEQGLLDNTDDVQLFFQQRSRQMEEVINHAAKVLSGLTQYTALVMSPTPSEARIRNLQLVGVAPTKALVIIVTDGGTMRDTIIPISADLNNDALYAISRSLTEMLSGQTLAQAGEILSTENQRCNPETFALMEGVHHFVDEADKQGAKAKIALGGASNILNFPEYSDIEKVKGFLSVLETKDTLQKLLQSNGDMAFSVHIGPETGIPELEHCSLVTASYCIDNHTQGSIGVIGPIRMQYGKVFSALQAMGQQLTTLFAEDKE